MFYNFTQVQGQSWNVKQMNQPGPTFNAASDSKERAVESFLYWMWGGKDRPDRLSFEDFKKRSKFIFSFS